MDLNFIYRPKSLTECQNLHVQDNCPFVLKCHDSNTSVLFLVTVATALLENPVIHWEARTVAWIDVRCYHRHCYLFEVSKACLNTTEHAAELLKAVRAAWCPWWDEKPHVINPKRTPLAQNAPCIVIFQRYTIWVTQTAEQWVCMCGGGTGLKA